MELELEEWLAVYQAVSLTAASKERVYWGVGGACLIANTILLALAAYVSRATWLEDWRYLTTALAVIGVGVGAYWLAIQHRLGREAAHWQGLLRQLEGEFAGAEFHRSALRLLKGQPVRTPTTTVHFDEWYPEVARLGWFARAAARLMVPLVPTLFLIAWILLGLIPWLAG
ncbi:hypothetical protein H5T53_07205 [Candidatus Bipolaricaulota bacterium]|nr:hypothetical protein [Candidatus Bipolaricaulota bacterium]